MHKQGWALEQSMLGLGQIYLAIDQHEMAGPVSREPAENKLISAKHLPSRDAHRDETTRVHLILRSMLFALVLIPITLCFVRFEIKVRGGKCSRDGGNYADLGPDNTLSGGLLISHINIIVCLCLPNEHINKYLSGDQLRWQGGSRRRQNMINCRHLKQWKRPDQRLLFIKYDFIL